MINGDLLRFQYGGILRLSNVSRRLAKKKAAQLATTPTPARGLRADARRNRERLLTVAHELFGARGADVSLDDIAREAQVGIGTLYRHFPTREALLAATCDDRLLALAEGRAAPHGKAADALQTFLESLVRHAGMYRGLATSLGVVLKNGSPGCHAATTAGERLLAQAQDAGEVRRDVDFDDVVCMATAISLATAEDSRRVHRLVAMFLDGLRTAPRVTSAR